ncbi:MAG: transcriptional regulator [Epulopiscium sp. Nele67-Bin004]|nr:MAG: transcriptional regulator [Epulopiscium sp. Nele67-Bin004]
MNGDDRKTIILKQLSEASDPISATTFGKQFSVSRQVIVGDIALLRARGEQIIATPRGYIVEKQPHLTYTIACKHTEHQLLDELYTIVDNECGVIDVTVEHSIYGQLSGPLYIFTREDADNFAKKLTQENVQLLCHLTKDFHFHKICCPTTDHYNKVVSALNQKGFLVS